jgi:hypothetical protein
MAILNSILSKLGVGHDDFSSASSSATAVDVVEQLEQKAAAHPLNLHWRTSIVDLLTLLEVDNSFPARKVLAVELGCPPRLMTESTDMNNWLHKHLLRKIAENGGNVPASLLS